MQTTRGLPRSRARDGGYRVSTSANRNEGFLLLLLRFFFFSSVLSKNFFQFQKNFHPFREREREIFSTKKEKIFTSLHSPSRALFCDAAQKTRIQKKRTRKRERNANRGHESHAFAVASRVRLYRGVHLFLSPHFFF